MINLKMAQHLTAKKEMAKVKSGKQRNHTYNKENTSLDDSTNNKNHKSMMFDSKQIDIMVVDTEPVDEENPLDAKFIEMSKNE